jgi:hypothetical protein
MLTLVIMVLVGMIPVQLVQQLDHVGVAIGAGELIAGAVKAEDELVGLLFRRGLVNDAGHDSVSGIMHNLMPVGLWLAAAGR